jgi:hypothetical protein
MNYELRVTTKMGWDTTWMRSAQGRELSSSGSRYMILVLWNSILGFMFRASGCVGYSQLNEF